ncbi:MAG: Alpha-amylase 2 [Bacteroidota bacterium]|jgi:glycosidase
MKILTRLSLLTAGLLSLATFACKTPETPAEPELSIAAPDWSKNAVIYEINTRQYSQEGTFLKVEKDLERIQSLGVDILWFMPIHPIGVKNRKGGLGSYYSVQDYMAVNPEYGTVEDFKRLVQQAHKRGMKVILDWVANHTAWDNVWIDAHDDWYEHDSSGQKISPWDWTDVAKLNYQNPEMREAMIQALEYWVKECDVDGYRCDVAFMVPVDFWNQAALRLHKIKNVFMLAEMEGQTDINPNFNAYFDSAFHANYGWSFHGTTHEIAQGKKTASDLRKYVEDRSMSDRVYRMYFLTNHDENSWNGTIAEKYGDNWRPYSVLCYTMPQSFPMIYNGQEAGLNKRLAFFEKDAIDCWADTSEYAWYRKLNSLKHQSPVLANGNQGGAFRWLGDNSESALFAYIRESAEEKIITLVNLGNETESFESLGWLPSEKSVNYLGNAQYDEATESWSLPAHGYQIFTEKSK